MTVALEVTQGHGIAAVRLAIIITAMLCSSNVYIFHRFRDIATYTV